MQTKISLIFCETLSKIFIKISLSSKFLIKIIAGSFAIIKVTKQSGGDYCLNRTTFSIILAQSQLLNSSSASLSTSETKLVLIIN